MARISRSDIPPDRINDLLKKVGNDPKLQNSLKQGNLNDVLGSLPPQEAQMVRNVLNDPKQLRSILSTPEAQQLMKQLKMR